MRNGLRRFWSSLSLPAQHGALHGALAVAALAIHVGVWGWEARAAGFLIGVLAVLAAAHVFWAHRSSRALHRLWRESVDVRRTSAEDGVCFSPRPESREWQRAARGLQRMVARLQRRELALRARAQELNLKLDLRTHELTTLENLSIGLAGKAELHELVDEALGALEQTLSYSSASVWSREELRADAHVVLMGYRHSEDIPGMGVDGLRGQRLSRANLQHYEKIEREGRPVVDNRVRQGLWSWLWSFLTDDARTSDLYRRTRSWMAVPMKSRDQVLGVLRVDHGEPDYFDVERMRLLAAVGSQTGLALKHAQLLSVQKETAVLAERSRIARDLHDAVSQTLFAANIIAGTLARSIERDPTPDPDRLKEQALNLERLNRGALAEMRLLMFELKPEALERASLAELIGHVLNALGCRADLVVERRLDASDTLRPEQRVQVYRIAQEALSNVARHSQASRVEVEWRALGPGRGTLRVVDDGCGFDPEHPRPGHFGLGHMAERAEDVGAHLQVTSAPGRGTEVVLTLGSSEDDAPADGGAGSPDKDDS